MKKFTLIALVAMFLLPSAMKAESFTTEVSTKSELTSAFSLIGTGAAGETYEIILTNDVTDPISFGGHTTAITNGRVVIRSNETDYDKMPILLIGFNGITTVEGDYGQQMSLIFENINLQYYKGNTASSGQIIYYTGVDASLDTVAFRHCELTNTPRTIYRSVPAIDENGDYITKSIDVLEMVGCRLHDNNISSGNNWFSFVVGQFINTITFKDNLIYDIPYSKGVWQMSYVSDTGAAPTVTFENNSVFVAANKSLATKGFNVLSPGNILGPAATYTINNNIFIGPEKGVRILVNDTCGYDGSTKILNVSEGCLVYASNNVIDTVTYKPWEAESQVEKGNWLYYEIANDYLPAEAGFTSWEAGEVFQDPERSYYYMLTSSPAYTMGVDGTYLGASCMYVDEFPVEAVVDITIDGPSYIDYTITPTKEVYYVGDEITITLNDHNSYYRTFNVFNGWSDGNTETTRTLTIEGDTKLSASFSETLPMIAAFDLSSITGSSKPSTYSAELYYNMDEAYQAVATAYAYDTLTTAYAIENFETRTNKFGEDAEEIQMPILSRRTAAAVKEVARDYAEFKIKTTGFSGINFSCFVGTDNNAAKIQALDYSTDGSTWERVASVELTNGVWYELAGTLPESADDKDSIYVRVIGDLTDGHIVTPDTAGGLVDDSGNEIESAYLSTDAFEYIGNILITAETNSGIREITADGVNANDANAPIYNLMGIQVDSNAKGILIQNGKKFIVK